MYKVRACVFNSKGDVDCVILCDFIEVTFEDFCVLYRNGKIDITDIPNELLNIVNEKIKD